MKCKVVLVERSGIVFESYMAQMPQIVRQWEHKMIANIRGQKIIRICQM